MAPDARSQASPQPDDVFDPAALSAAMGELKAAIGDLRRQIKDNSHTARPEARAQLREKARTGQLKLNRGPAQTGPVAMSRTGRVDFSVPSALPTDPTLEAPAPVEGWESLSELAAQNDATTGQPPQKPRP